MSKKYTDKQLKEFLSGHHLCGWISEDRRGCDCGHYDALYKKDPDIALQLVEFVKRDMIKEEEKL